MKRGRDDSATTTNNNYAKRESLARDTSKLTCYHCGKVGHIASACWSKNPHLRNKYNIKSHYKVTKNMKEPNTDAIAMHSIVTDTKHHNAEQSDNSDISA